MSAVSKEDDCPVRIKPSAKQGKDELAVLDFIGTVERHPVRVDRVTEVC